MKKEAKRKGAEKAAEAAELTKATEAPSTMTRSSASQMTAAPTPLTKEPEPATGATPEAPPEPSKLTEAIKMGSSFKVRSEWNAEKGAWEDKQYGECSTLLQSAILKAKLNEMNKNGYILTVFPDTKDHLHLDKR